MIGRFEKRRAEINFLEDLLDNIAAAGEIAPKHMAGGLKMALIGPLMGIIAFLGARLVILILQMKSKKESFEEEPA